MKRPTDLMAGLADRKTIARAAGVLTILAMTTGLFLSGGLADAGSPRNADDGQATTASITKRNLPKSKDMAWHHHGDWKSTATYQGTGPAEATPCLRSKASKLGAQRIFQRDFLLSDVQHARGSALTLQFQNKGAAEAAYAKLATWSTHCAGTLVQKEFTQLGLAQSHQVKIPGATARFTEIAYRAFGDDRDGAFFEAIGLVRVGNRVNLISMTICGLDNNWAYDADDDTGLALHPMFRTLPRSGDRLDN